MNSKVFIFILLSVLLLPTSCVEASKAKEEKKNTAPRIINIVNYRATNKIVAYIAAVLIIIIAVGLLTVPDAAGHNIFNLLTGIS